MPLSTVAEINEKVEVSMVAFEEWREIPLCSRARYLFRLRNIMDERVKELAQTIV